MLCPRALKEWAVIVDALGAGDQTILLRKGGIADVGGEFHLESESFCLWPTYLHQDNDLLRPAETARLRASLAAQPSPDEVDVTVWAEVAHIHIVPSRAALDGLADEHIWSAAYLDQRWRYRPDLPLYLLVLRAHRLAHPLRLAESPAYRGCRSWIDFAAPPELPPWRPALADAAFAARAQAVARALGGS
jgi:hypothetical protein